METVFRKGSLIDPEFPAASVFGNQMCDEVLESIMTALAEPLPDLVCAGWNQFLPASLSGVDPRTGEVYVDLLLFSRGGSGAMKGTDGYDGIGFTGTPGSMRSQDMEIFELSTPHTVDYVELETDSAGAGQWRGGYGTRTRFSFDGEGVRGSTLGDDSEAEGAAPAQGLFGGEDGTPQRAEADRARRHRARLGLEGGRPDQAGHRLRLQPRRRRRLRRPPQARPRGWSAARSAKACSSEGDGARRCTASR